MDPIYKSFIPLLLGWFADRELGDPERLPHPVVAFGRVIAAAEKKWNNGNNRKLRGAFLSVGLILLTYEITRQLLHYA